MTLDEAIKHAEDVAEEEYRKISDGEIKNYRGSYYTGEVERCEKCAKEHQQLAQWLKELRDYKEASYNKIIYKEVDKKIIHCKDCKRFEKDLGILGQMYNKCKYNVIINPMPLDFCSEAIEDIKCKKCGEKFDKYPNFCPNCGERLREMEN